MKGSCHNRHPKIVIDIYLYFYFRCLFVNVLYEYMDMDGIVIYGTRQNFTIYHNGECHCLYCCIQIVGNHSRSFYVMQPKFWHHIASDMPYMTILYEVVSSCL